MVTDPNEMPEEARQLIELYIKTLSKLFEEPGDELHQCVHCQQSIERLEQHGRCVYAYPCGCRLYQGILPAWVRSRQG